MYVQDAMPPHPEEQMQLPTLLFASSRILLRMYLIRYQAKHD